MSDTNNDAQTELDESQYLPFYGLTPPPPPKQKASWWYPLILILTILVVCMVGLGSVYVLTKGLPLAAKGQGTPATHAQVAATTTTHASKPTPTPGVTPTVGPLKAYTMAQELTVNPAIAKAWQCPYVYSSPWKPAQGTVCVRGYGDIQGVSATVDYYVEVFNTHQHALDDQTSIYAADHDKPHYQWLPYEVHGLYGACLVLAGADENLDQQGIDAISQVCSG